MLDNYEKQYLRFYDLRHIHDAKHYSLVEGVWYEIVHICQTGAVTIQLKDGNTFELMENEIVFVEIANEEYVINEEYYVEYEDVYEDNFYQTMTNQLYVLPVYDLEFIKPLQDKYSQYINDTSYKMTPKQTDPYVNEAIQILYENEMNRLLDLRDFIGLEKLRRSMYPESE